MIRVRCDQFSKHWGFLFSQLLTKLIFRFLWNWNDTNYSNVCYTLLGNSHLADVYSIFKILFVQKIVFDFQRISFKVKNQSFFIYFVQNSVSDQERLGRKVLFMFEIINLKKLQIYIFCTLKIWRRSHWLSETVNSWAVNYFSWFSKPFTEKPWLLEFQKIKDFETCSIAGNVKTD